MSCSLIPVPVFALINKCIQSIRCARQGSTRKIFPAIVAYLVLMAGIVPAHAGTFTVFGPQTYQRSAGSPATETASFSALDPTTTYSLNVYNGGLEDNTTTGELVSSGTIDLNGAHVVGSSNFNQQVTSLSESVSLQSANNIAVTLKGKPGGQILVEIVGIDNVPPQITATISPQPDANGNNSGPVTVTFTCTDGTSGISFCTDPIVVSTPGLGQVITGTATDNAGNTAETSVTINIVVDSDNDGVLDGDDLCPNTPVGEAVDATGCSTSQLDTDGDGVSNALDQCPGTPAGEAVDPAGCSATQLDDDGDGVANSIDECPNTPAGEGVNAVGCSSSQLDSDSDGVSDAEDLCPGTPAGEAVDIHGCSASQLDSDDDGVSDASDICPDTPVGETVDVDGCSQSQLDADNDGVTDNLDQCPNTPVGESVDANGCSATQLDSDNDGVSDAEDLCPGTTAGEIVDASGCSPNQLDSDDDGVSDAADQCPNTPVGEIVDTDGCSQSQLDTDNDGITDNLDQCSNTPAGETVDTNGCSATQLDSDNDGVSDADDLCPATPAGEVVDPDGCSQNQLDSDDDGVSDATDQCPDTPAGEPVDTNGCSESQLDTDNDGVTDNIDQCPNTSAGESVNTDGCSTSQLDSDSDGITDDLDICPGTPTGEPVDASGCSSSQLDTDNDGINDASDICPGTPAGEPVDNNGCSTSQLDSDNDGVTDDLDQCPNTVAGDPVDFDGCSISQGGSGPIPPDPSLVAPPVDITTPTSVFDATEFLYTGPNAIQTGVAANTIEPERVAVLRGRVLDRDDQPLAGVKITVLGHPEYGHTVSRLDGEYDLAVNGGGSLTVDYQRMGYLPLQRKTKPEWQSFRSMPDVVMIGLDTQVTTLDLTSGAPMYVASGSVETDSDGSRQATVMFPAGTTANLILPGGGTQPVSTINVRATEYTVGANGREAMPGELPPSSGYTYAVELSVDEAMAAGAKSIQFSQPVMVYVENFIGFPVGGSVPAGYYDYSRAAWIPSSDGRVIEIVGVTGGLADIDVDGSGLPASGAMLTSMGFTSAELTQLASYVPGTSLWRVPIIHFSPWDFNWPYGPPANAESPQVASPVNPDGENKQDDSDCQENSIIDCQNQALGERVDVVGAPFTLNYKSDRVPGRTAAYTLEIPVTESNPPLGLKRVDIEIQVAGKRVSDSVMAIPDQIYTYVWDGKDVYGRTLFGAQPATVRVGYVYDAVYYDTITTFENSFNQYGGAPISAQRALNEIKLWQELDGEVGDFDARMFGLGGWTLNIHHAYDIANKTLYKGDGSRRTADKLPEVVQTVAGTGILGNNGIGGQAANTELWYPQGIAIGPDGSFYIAENVNHRVIKVGLDGVTSLVAGVGSAGFSGDGGDAKLAELDSPIAVDINPDGSIYIADTGNNRIRRVAPNGIITTVAGSGPSGYLGSQIAGDGGPAVNAIISSPIDLEISADGTLYIVDNYNNRVRRVTPDGIIESYFVNTFSSSTIRALSLRSDGVLFVALSNVSSRLLKITPDGKIDVIIGPTSFSDPLGDGGLAVNARIDSPRGVIATDDGLVYIADSGNRRIRKITPDGIISTIAGNGTPYGFDGDGRAATQTNIGSPGGFARSPQGELYFSEANYARVRKISPALPGLGDTELAIASEDGSEIYVFSFEGRHLRTLNAMSGAVIYLFTYDSNNYLTQIDDGDGNIYQIQRVGSIPTSIVSPDGQITSLSVDGSGFLNGITSPEGLSYLANYTLEGLLTDFTDPRGNASIITYHADGRLQRDTNAAAGYFDLTLTESMAGFAVAMVSAEGRLTNYNVENLPTGERKRTNSYPEGTVQETVFDDIGAITTITRPDGTVRTLTEGPDPRFGMQATIPSKLEIITPGGLNFVTTMSRGTNLSDPADLFSIIDQTDTISINGRIYISAYDAATQTYTDTTPEGRQVLTAVDAQGRIVSQQNASLEPLVFGYDTRGRITSIVEGTGASARTTLLTYDTAGFVGSITDAEGRAVSLEYNLDGRVIRQTMPGNRLIQYAYDNNGNITSITPPGQPIHQFSYTPVDLERDYDPPNVGGPDVTQTFYNLDKQLTQAVRPDAATLDYTYNHGGQLTQLLIPRGSIGYTYNALSGNVETVTAPGGVGLSYGYDGSLLLSETWTGPVTGTVSRQYDNNFRIIERTVDGTAITFGYDDDSLLTQAGALALTRNPLNGLLTNTALATTATSQSYNGFGELASLTAQHGGSTLYNVTYTRDNLGRITQKDETIQGVTTSFGYNYDVEGRLFEVRENGVLTASYTYDSNGNRLTRTTAAGTETGTYDAQDRLTNYDGTIYNYKASGELSTSNQSGAITQYNYDVLGNLIAVTLPDTTQVDYIIDGANRRIGKKVNGILVQGFLYQDQLKPIAEMDGTGSVISRFVYAEKANVPAYMVKGGVTYRIVSDHLGSPRLVINIQDGSIVQRMDFDDFGQVVLDTNPGFQPFGFAGGIYDLNTKLVRFGERDYDPAIGRWTNKDPIYFNGGDPNLYSYVWGDPINIIDPNGLVGRGPYQPSPQTALEQAIIRGDVQGIRTLLEAGETIEAESLKRCVSKRAGDLVRGYKKAGRGTGSRSGQHGTPHKQAGAQLGREGNLIGGDIGQALKDAGVRLINKGGGINHY